MNIIKKRRRELKLKQQDLEDKLGISRERISRLERGDTAMSIGDLRKLCQFLDIDWDMYYKTDGVTVSEKI